MNSRRRDDAFPDGYWAEPGRLYAGEYPGHRDRVRAEERIAAVLDAGIDYFVDLTWPDELPPYVSLLPSPYEAGPRGPVTYSRRPIRDHSIPADPLHMVEILDELDDALRGGHSVYVHCRAGIGRTGTVIGCWLARRLGGGVPALAALDNLWQNAGRDEFYPQTPETDEQTAYVRAWREAALRVAPDSTASAPAAALSTPAPRAAATPARPPTTRVTARDTPADGAAAPPIPSDPLAARVQGLLFGLAAGDALGMPYEGGAADAAAAVRGFAAGGPHDLPAGAWTDDTAVALLLAESLLERGANDARDQVQRYARWQREGYGSSTGRCVGLGPTAARALAQAQWSGNAYSGAHDPAKADKDPLPRAAIAAAWSYAAPEAAIALAAEVARTTHQAPATLDACRYFAALIVGALSGASREALLVPSYSPVPGLWERRPLRGEVAAVANGGWRAREVPSGGGAVQALEIALWSLERGRTWREAMTIALPSGPDAAANGAIVGALAGAVHGAGGIPASLRAGVVGAQRIAALSQSLATAAAR